MSPKRVSSKGAIFCIFQLDDSHQRSSSGKHFQSRSSMGQCRVKDKTFRLGLTVVCCILFIIIREMLLCGRTLLCYLFTYFLYYWKYQVIILPFYYYIQLYLPVKKNMPKSFQLYHSILHEHKFYWKIIKIYLFYCQF